MCPSANHYCTLTRAEERQSRSTKETIQENMVSNRPPQSSFQKRARQRNPFEKNNLRSSGFAFLPAPAKNEGDFQREASHARTGNCIRCQNPCWPCVQRHFARH